jgi:hypothetical protein
MFARAQRASKPFIAMSWFARFIRPCLFLGRSILSTSFSVTSGSSLKMTTLDSSAEVLGFIVCSFASAKCRSMRLRSLRWRFSEWCPTRIG